jgi:hypothetical protein
MLRLRSGWSVAGRASCSAGQLGGGSRQLLSRNAALHSSYISTSAPQLASKSSAWRWSCVGQRINTLGGRNTGLPTGGAKRRFSSRPENEGNNNPGGGGQRGGPEGEPPKVWNSPLFVASAVMGGLTLAMSTLLAFTSDGNEIDFNTFRTEYLENGKVRTSIFFPVRTRWPLLRGMPFEERRVGSSCVPPGCRCERL